ncbi:hypothetical protein ACN47E_010300 [Coniothyrium glycines]
MAPSDLKNYFAGRGFKVKSMRMGYDRFTFRCLGPAFVELENEQQAAEAVGVAKLYLRNFTIKRLRADFDWNQPPSSRPFGGSKMFRYEGRKSSREAVRPYMEDRRIQLMAQPPGWGAKSLAVLEEYLQRHDVEAVGAINDLGPAMNLPIKEIKKMRTYSRGLLPLCIIDFQTQKGAMNAMRTLSKRRIKGRLIEMRPWQMTAKIAYQVGHVDSRVLVELQAKGLAPLDPSPPPYEGSPLMWRWY